MFFNSDQIIICGDVHGYHSSLIDIIDNNTKDSSINYSILQLGDFGYFPNLKRHSINPYNYFNLPENINVFWIDGNHEDHDSLNELYEENRSKDEPIMVGPNVYWIPRGTILENKKFGKFLCIGGAASIDAQYRTLGVDYFLGEKLSIQQENKILDTISNNSDIKTIISHTCPRFLVPSVVHAAGTSNPFYKMQFSDPTEKFLEEVYNRVGPIYWYFGHWHTYLNTVHGNTMFECLNYTHQDNSKSFTILK